MGVEEGTGKGRCGGKVLTLRPSSPPDLSPFEVLNVPALSLIPVAKAEEIEKALKEADVVVFTSRTGVKIIAKCCPEIFEKIKELEVYAIGPSTAEELKKYGIDSKVPNVFTSEGLASLLSDKKKIVAIRSDKASKTLREALGDKLIEVIAYRTVRNYIPEAIQLIEKGEVEAVVISSAEIARALIESAKKMGYDPKDLLKKTKVVVIGPEAAKPLMEENIEYYMASEASFEGVRRKLLELLCIGSE
ncbi:hypothetical protein IPA_09250 [Ignicoccus pacificus DSM 13166]|uniref:Tetrapyrrole biosynthesis uroporphyrinogen III synthase domain-containing protein n=1 Tax=Ignicoccus pacificus DSM 13166 TaxID=940294 RepID=A0A977PLV9_9CREN|nr:hypothetical protein IPA_09250 [Ignicoccus pacificus DSM 13166]